MKNVKIEFPYVTYEVDVYFEDIDNHPDPQVRRNITDAMGWEKYRIWYAMHQNGIKKPYRIRNKVHVGHAFKNPTFVGMAIGYVFSFSLIFGIVGIAGYGIFKLIKFLLGLL